MDGGCAEAREVLDSLSMLEGEIADNIDKTYDLVQVGLDAFLNNNEDRSGLTY